MKKRFTLGFIGFCFYASVLCTAEVGRLKSADANGCQVHWQLLDDGKTARANYTSFDEDAMKGNVEAQEGLKNLYRLFGDIAAKRGKYYGFPGLVERGIVHQDIEFYYDGNHFWMREPKRNMWVRASRTQQDVVVIKHPSYTERPDNERAVEYPELAWFLKSRAMIYHALPERQAGFLRQK